MVEQPLGGRFSVEVEPIVGVEDLGIRTGCGWASIPERKPLAVIASQESIRTIHTETKCWKQ